MFSAIVLTYLLLASAVLASPSSKADRRSNTLQHLEARTIHTDDLAGAVTIYDPGTFTSATGLIAIPTLSGAGGISIRVGIDAYSCQNGSLQTGVNATIFDGGHLVLVPWYRRDPDIFGTFFNITLSPGDSVRLTVNASSHNGTATIENLTTGVTVSQDNLHSQNTLCQQDVEWMVQVGNFIPGMGNFVFSEAGASTQSGLQIGPGGSNLMEIVRDSEVVNASVGTTTGTVTVSNHA